ncbi:MAG: heterodisulfide reductase-related iron-sulfur binding cluster, partial [Candidatus Competibacter sp.]
AELLADDPRYAAKAQRISERTRDAVEIVRAEPLESLNLRPGQRLAVHSPCTLQHAQKLGGAVEDLLRQLGFDLMPVPDAHLCCGSAGTYALTQPELASTLRDRKLDALESGRPELILTANIGCQVHLGSAGRTPVRHWIEWLDERAVLPDTRS